jgi:outer membrane protein TolC
VWLVLAALGSTSIALAADPVRFDDGMVEAYVAAAVAEHPRVVAERLASDAAEERIVGARALPDPRLSVGGFVQPVETRVGPQQVRVGVQQAIPWPTRLVSAGKAATSEAEAADWGVEGAEREVRERVELAYWSLWLVRAERALHQEHLAILDGLASTVRARIEVGAASLADLQQVDLSRSRLEDRIATLDAAEASGVAGLRAAVGVDELGPAPTRSVPERVVAPETSELVAGSHPRLRSMEARTDAAEHRVRVAASRRLPDFTVGADWVVTGPARMDGVEDSGKDAIALMVGLRLPVWQGVYGHDVAAAGHLESSLRERRRAGEVDIQGAIDATVVRLRDSARRADVVEQTLLPQAQAAYEAVLGEYAVGRAQVSQTLLAQRDLLELAIEHVEAQADHQMQWARLTSLTGVEP